MSYFESYYECRKCFYKCKQKIDMSRHIDKLKKCVRSIESYQKFNNLNDIELDNLSSKIIKYEKPEKNQKIEYLGDKKFKCKLCNKCFSRKDNIKRHLEKYCKSHNNGESNIEENIIEESINKLNNNSILDNNIEVIYSKKSDVRYIYCLSNSLFIKGLYKVGFTKKNPNIRSKELSSTSSIAVPFKVEFSKKIINYDNEESKIHKLLESIGTRINPKREFFIVDLYKIKLMFDLVKGEYYNNINNEFDLQVHIKEEDNIKIVEETNINDQLNLENISINDLEEKFGNI